MANWVYTLDLVGIWEKAKNEEVAPSAVAEEISRQLEQLKLPKSLQPDPIIIKKMKNAEDWIEFDVYLNSLYNWADTSLPTPLGGMERKLCWIKTF